MGHAEVPSVDLRSVVLASVCYCGTGFGQGERFSPQERLVDAPELVQRVSSLRLPSK